MGALIGFHHWNSPRIVSHLLIAEVLFVALWVLVFDRLGSIAETYALSMKDELYYTVAALMLGTIPQLVLFTIYPGISTSRIALIFALIVFDRVGRLVAARCTTFANANGSLSRRRVSIVGTAEDIDRVLESLELGSDAETQLIVRRRHRPMPSSKSISAATRT